MRAATVTRSLLKTEPYLQKHDVWRTQVSPEFSPGMQVGIFPGLQVMLHFGQGGGPSAVQVEGCVRSQPGVGVGDETFDLLDDFGDAALAIDSGKSIDAINKITTANDLSFIKSFDLHSTIGRANYNEAEANASGQRKRQFVPQKRPVDSDYAL